MLVIVSQHQRPPHLVIDDDAMYDVAVPQHVLLTLGGEGAESAMQTVVLFIYSPLFHLGVNDAFLLLNLN